MAGQISDQPGLFSPVLMQPKDLNSILMQQEIFGFIFVIYPYSSEEQMIELSNHSSFGLNFSIFDNNPKHANHLGNKINSGGVFVNMASASFNELPWGGVNNSGFGRDNGIEGLESFALIKTTVHSKKRPHDNVQRIMKEAP